MGDRHLPGDALGAKEARSPQISAPPACQASALTQRALPLLGETSLFHVLKCSSGGGKGRGARCGLLALTCTLMGKRRFMRPLGLENECEDMRSELGSALPFSHAFSGSG